MQKDSVQIDFLHSEFCEEGRYITIADFLKWLQSRRDSVRVSVEMVPFSLMERWAFDPKTGNLQHESGRFFSIIGIEVSTNWGLVNNWTQPIINQPEIGFLGIIAKKIDGILHFLMQSKIEPGNINAVQLSPTLQATKSNYTKVHKGATPLYLEYFNGDKPSKILLDQLQSEQGARFFKKRNRNIIIEVTEDIDVKEDFCWLTLGQIKNLLQYPNLVNMDTRTVLSGVNFGQLGMHRSEIAFYLRGQLSNQDEMIRSAMANSDSLHPIDDVISWITQLKSTYDLDVNRIPLKSVEKWVRSDRSIYHASLKYFSIIAANVSISNREVTQWSQPMVKSAQEGLIAFIIKEIKGVMHFLVQAKIEAGNFDILELAPTVQCLTGNYRKGMNEYEVPFIQTILESPDENVVYKAMQSEEGGRFYLEQNLNMIVRVGDDFSIEVPKNYCWMTLNQLYTFIRFNNYLNIQARSLLAAVKF